MEDHHRATGQRSRAAALAARLAALRWSAVPGPVRDRVTTLVADTLAVAALGSRRPDVRTVQASLLDGRGPATVVGRSDGHPVSAAAAANAAAITAHQLQDGHRGARGHPGAHVIPATLAVAEASGATGPAFLAAILVGYEAAVRVSLAMGGTRAGVHDIGSWGSVGAAVAVAHLLGDGDPTVIEHAILGAAAATLTTHAPTVFDGYGMQHLFLAEAARIGLDIGRAAAAGISAHPDALAHLARHIAAEWDPKLLAAEEPWRYEIVDGYIKRHPTCAYLHGVNDAVESLIAADDGVVGQAVSATVRTFRQAVALPSAVPPRNALTARFNIPWAVATALTTGTIDEASFGDQAMADPELLRLAQAVVVEHDAALDPLARDGRPAEVIVRLRDGRTVSARVYRPRGDGDVDPDVLRTKAERLLRGRVGPDAAVAVLATVQHLADAEADLSSLTTALRAAAGGACTDLP